MLKVFQSGSAAERLSRARAFVTEHARSGEVVVLASTRSAADDFARDLAAQSPATAGLHRMSMVQYAFQLARSELASRGLAPVTATGAMALAVRCIFEVGTQRNFTFFSPVVDKPGFSAALASTIHELRASAVKANELVQLGPRGQDLGALISEYEAQLTSGDLADMIEVFGIATQVIEASAEKSMPPIVLLDVPVQSQAEVKLIAGLASKSVDVLATAVDGDSKTVAAFRKLAADYQVGPARVSTSLDRLQNFVFGSTPDSSYAEDKHVEFFSAPGEGRECVEIARRIQDAARSGTRFDQVAIALRSQQTYAPLLEAALERAGIPVYFARGTRRPDASGRALIALLMCAEEGLSAKRFAEYLSLGQVPELLEAGTPPVGRQTWVPANDDLIQVGTAVPETPLPEPPPAEAREEDPLVAGALRTPWKWEELLVEAAVVGGRERWNRRLNGLAKEIDHKIEEIALEEPDSPQIDRLKRERQNLGHLRQFALPVLDALSELPVQSIWGEWLTALQHLSPIVLRRPEYVLAVLSELHPIANVGPVTLSEVREALTARLSELAVEPPKSRYGRVFVGSPEQLRGRAFSIVFVPGLAERIFPQKLREDPLLLDGDRQRLSGADPSLATLADRGSEERLRLRIVAGAAEEKMYFSYPRVEVALARPRVPSFYALDVRRTTLGRLPNIEEFEREAARNSGAELAWLAPEKPAAAIDDIEHDLSVLRPLLQADPKSVRGGARYLMELSPELGRSLRGRYQRWHKKWGAADGLCEVNELTKEQLVKYRLANRAYSPTSLQSFAACPYKFLLSAIHRLSAREESVALETLDPLTRGHLYHTVVARFLRGAVAKKMLPVSEGSVAKVHSMVDKILQETAAEYHEQLAPAIERVWQDEIELLRADLRGWITQMAERGEAYVPELIEFGFGLPTDPQRDSASTREPAKLPNGFLIHGIVDLVEKNPAGERRVTDHKTGKDRTEEGMVVAGGEVLQPVLYSLGVESLRGTPVKEARLSFCTAAGGYRERTVVMDAISRNAAINVLETIDRAIEKGFLPAAPKEEGCKWCDFAQVCGPYEEIRVAKKDERPLSELVQLREMP
jgi:ATP-dependent helicase/nuclease subunit B